MRLIGCWRSLRRGAIKFSSSPSLRYRRTRTHIQCRAGLGTAMTAKREANGIDRAVQPHFSTEPSHVRENGYSGVRSWPGVSVLQACKLEGVVLWLSPTLPRSTECARNADVTASPCRSRPKVWVYESRSSALCTASAQSSTHSRNTIDRRQR